MILKALTLENFKGIGEPVRIEFAPLTLLFGPNNAGKSTIVQALMYAREVLECNNCDPGHTQLGGEIVDLGGFENIVHAHDLSRPIRMRFELDLGGIPTPEVSRWIAEHEFESQTDWLFDNAPKRLEWYSSDQIWSRLQEVWVEIEVAWREATETNPDSGPVVRAYSVGKGTEVYATLSLSDKDHVELSYFNFGIYPFGTRYAKGDAADFEWDLQRIVRDRVRVDLQESDQPGLGLKKGARVAMQGDQVRKGENTLPRSEFDELVSRIANGEGEYGRAASDEDGGEQNRKYKFRQALVESARLLGESRRNLADIVADLDLKLDIDFSASQEATPHCDEVASGIEAKAAVDTSSVVQDDPSESDKVAESDEEDEVVSAGWEDRRSLSYGLRCDEQEELDSWMLDLFDALVMEDYVPYVPERATPLKLRGAALPKWGKFLELGSETWIPYRQNEFWENPRFVEEYLNDLLTTIIAGPGEGLLDVLRNSVYISPFREMPPRHYQPARSPEPRRWANGLAAWDWLLLEDKSFAGRVNEEWLSAKHRFDAGYDIDVRHYRELGVDSPLLAALTDREGGTDLDLDWVREQLLTLPEGRRLKIRDLRSGVSLFPQDLGVGISQVIPVIVAALHNTSGIVAIEEPESNIHPAFQVVLADLFINQAKANPDVLFLVETHSEHLMLRCLRRIRETNDQVGESDAPAVTPEDIAVHFVEPSEQGPVIHRIRIDEDGEFMDPWPRGFFLERMKEVYGDDF